MAPFLQAQLGQGRSNAPHKSTPLMPSSVARASPRLLQAIRDHRNNLEATLFRDDNLEQLQWTDASGHETEIFAQHKTQTLQVLNDEQEYRHISSRLIKPLEKNLLEEMILDLQHQPSYKRVEERLKRAKYIVKLIFAADKSQADPQCGQNPLHVAAMFDIAMPGIEENAISDLTRFTLEAMGDSAGPAIERVNTQNENILHLAIRHHLIGVTELIQAAGKAAFRQKRGLGEEGAVHQEGHGNTPLHDALQLRHFMAKMPLCPTRREAGAEVPVPWACETCQKADQKNQSALSKRREIIEALLARDSSVLTIQNSAGLPPYVFLRHAFGKEDDDFPEMEDEPQSQSGQDEQGLQNGLPPPLSDSIIAGGWVDVAAPAQLPFVVAPLPKLDIPPVSNNITLTEKATRNLGIKFNFDSGPSPTQKAIGLRSGQTESSHHPEELGSRVVRRPGKAIAPGPAPGPLVEQDTERRDNLHMTVELAELVEHNEDQLREDDIGSEIILKVLRNEAYRLGTYDDTRKALFARQTDLTLPGYDSSTSEKQHFFAVDGYKRVSHNTDQNFDFLQFERRLAWVTLNLRYTAEEERRVKDLPEIRRAEKWEEDQENLKKFFKWLKLKKGVREIIKLTVKDNEYHFCSDFTVKDCLKGLQVRYLDWRRPDLCANGTTLPKTLVGITLYWKGLDAVLWSWSDTEGLRTLKELQKIQVFYETNKLADSSGISENEHKVQDFIKRVSKWPTDSPSAQVLPTPYDNLSRISDGLMDSNIPVTPQMKHSWMEAAERFSDDAKACYLSLTKEEKEKWNKCRIKIALLDDGVDPTYDDHIGSNLHHSGWPPVDAGESEDGAQSFYVSTNQHGSQMAWLICRVCPFVTIYVAKLSYSRKGEQLRCRSFSLEEATKAVKWAKAQGVDIMSLSWNAREVHEAGDRDGNVGEVERLKMAISDAATNGHILMFGAACDIKESSSTDTWVPCDWNEVWSIGATDKNYVVKKYVDATRKTVDFLFPGEYVLDTIFNQPEVGNSGATALAAGLAAMVLFCDKVQGMEGRPLSGRRQWMQNVMQKVFNSYANDKVVHIKDVLEACKTVEDLAKKVASV